MERKRKWRARKGADVFDFGEDALARVLVDDGWEVWELEIERGERDPEETSG
jgi:hypothetical protein